MVGFHSLADEEVFPKCSHIIAQIQWCKILKDGIADTIIVEINLLAFFQLGSKVSAECGQSEDNVTLFQQVDVFLYCF